MKTLHSYDKVRQHICERIAFQTRERRSRDDGSLVRTIIAEWRDNVYVVYSYGTHYPLFVFDASANCWFANNEKSSRTTNHHRYRFAPPKINMSFNTETLRTLMKCNGYVQWVAHTVGAP